MRHAAFTLIELLVVISIIALLAAIAFPVFAISRRQARTVACRANIHGLLLSLHNYEAEHQSLPHGFDHRIGLSSPPGGYIGVFFLDKPGWWWFHFSGVVRDREQVDAIRCPSKKLEDSILDCDILCGNYGVNRSLCRTGANMNSLPSQRAFVGPPLSTSSIRHPGSTLLIVDSGYTLISWWQATAEPPAPLDASFEDTAYVPGLEINKERILWPGQSCDAIEGRHPKKTVNVGFADGHAELKKAADLLVEKTGEESYTNTIFWQGE